VRTAVAWRFGGLPGWMAPQKGLETNEPAGPDACGADNTHIAASDAYALVPACLPAVPPPAAIHHLPAADSQPVSRLAAMAPVFTEPQAAGRRGHAIPRQPPISPSATRQRHAVTILYAVFERSPALRCRSRTRFTTHALWTTPQTCDTMVWLCGSSAASLSTADGRQDSVMN